ncbi:MAG: BtrH N-terminal domain-containing protein [Nitrospirae bacterium]|nr:BtrH N-terminal domain-containing protein [Nitrospirota bacterium]
MPEIIRGWVHRPGRHCGSTSISDLMHFNGLPMSEALCFGLGSGLGCFYVALDGFSPSRTVATRAAGLEPNFFNLIGHPFAWRTDDSDERALEELRHQIRDGIPLLIQCDLKYLHYYKTQTSFSGHVIVAWGFDDERGICFVGDTQFPGLQEVPHADMARARTSQAFPMPVQNNWFPGKVDGLKGNLPDLMLSAVKANTREMMDDQSFVARRGVGGIRAFAEDLPNWAEVQDRKWCARFAYQVIEKRGTGGGAFRLLYAEFLEELERTVPTVKSLRLAEQMRRIAQTWQAVAALLKAESERETPGNLRAVADQVKVLADLEHAYYETVLRHVG